MDSYGNAVRCGKSKYKGERQLVNAPTRRRGSLRPSQARSMFAITSPATLVGAPTACFKVRDPFLVDDLPFRGRANPDPPDRRARKKI